MIFYIAAAVVGILFIPKWPAGAKNQSGVIAEIPQKNKNPASAQPLRADRGANANQPWVTGIFPQGNNTSQNIANGVYALSSLFTSASNTFFNSNQDATVQTVDPNLTQADQTAMLNANTDSELYPVDPYAGAVSDSTYSGDQYV